MNVGRNFENQAAAEFHASKTEHTDFSESTDEIAPLTEEEKANKLSALRGKLAAKKAVQSEQDIIDKKRNEQINRKKTKETQDMKEDLKKKEQIKDAEKKRQERQDDIDAKKRIQAKIAADKEERRLRLEKGKGRASRCGSSCSACAYTTCGSSTDILPNRQLNIPRLDYDYRPRVAIS